MPNGCTGIPWKTSFEHCCDEHDLAYEQSGSKREADWVLRQCVRVRGKPMTAWVVWAVVATLGWYWWIKTKREEQAGA